MQEDIKQKLERLRREIDKVAPAVIENPELKEILPIICIDCGKPITSSEGCSLFHTVPICLAAEEIDNALKGKKEGS